MLADVERVYTSRGVYTGGLSAVYVATVLAALGSVSTALTKREHQMTMHSRRFERGVRLVAAIGTALVLAACANGGTPATGGAPTTEASQAGTTFGPSQPLGNGTIKTFATLDDAGQPTEVGLRLSRPPWTVCLQDTGPGETAMLAFPDQAGRPLSTTSC